MIAVFYLKDVHVQIFVKISTKKEIKVFAHVYVKEESVTLNFVKIVIIVVILKLSIEYLKRHE